MNQVTIKTFSPVSHKINAVIYGASGSGKTHFAATAPKPIFASAEAGLLSTAGMGKKIDFVEIKSLTDLSGLLALLQSGKHEYETVVIDSISEINDIIKNEIEKKRGRVMQIQDWGELGAKIKVILRGFRDLNMHTVFIAQESVEKDDQKIQKIVPMLNGRAATEIAYFMDIVGYSQFDKINGHTIITLPHEKYLTKDRSNKIGNSAPNDFSEWVKLVAEIKTSDSMAEVNVEVEEKEKKPTPPSASAPASKPILDREKRITPDQTKRLFTEWNLYMKLSGKPKEKSEAIRKETMRKYFGKTSSTQLTVTEAQEFIERLSTANMKLETDADANAEKEETPPSSPTSPAVEESAPVAPVGEIEEPKEKSELLKKAEALFENEAEDVDTPAVSDKNQYTYWEVRFIDCKTIEELKALNEEIKAYMSSDVCTLSIENLKALSALSKELRSGMSKASSVSKPVVKKSAAKKSK